MFAQIKQWIVSKGLDMAEPYLADLIEKDKVQLIDIFNQSDSKVIAKQLIDAIKEKIK